MSREIDPGIHWIQELGPPRPGIAEGVLARDQTWLTPGRQVFFPQNAYLFRGRESLLFDTLSPAAGDHVIEEVQSILGDAGLDYLVVSHPDVPHAGNTMRILRRWPGCRLVAPRYCDTHALYHLEDSLRVGEGDTLDLGGPVLRFHEATFLDAAMSVWMTEEETRMLLPVDWMGIPVLDGEELRFTDEVDSPMTVDRLYEFHGRVMFWFQYVDVAKVQAETDRLWRKFRPSVVAPSHALVIREDVSRYFEMMKDVVARVAETGRIGVL